MKIKMPTSKEEFILRVLIGRGRLYGAEIVSVSKGRLKLGAIHVQLGKMEDKGLVKSELDDSGDIYSGSRKRFYSVTDGGKEIVGRIDEMNKEIFNL